MNINYGRGHYIRGKTNILKKSIGILIYLFFVCILFLSTCDLIMAEDRVIKVGFFEFEGYHEVDNQGRRGGYGYEYLHEMAKYTGWIYEYVDCTWEEAQVLLKNGEIDILTSAQYNEARDEIFDFSNTSMGMSYAQLSVLDGNSTYGRNDFAGFNGMRIGLLKGNSRNNKLSEFALEQGFEYSFKMYSTQSDLDEALIVGDIDAILTSSLRKLNNEGIVAQFAPSPFYAVVREGNLELLEQVNFALESIDMNSPAFRYNLYQEHYRNNVKNTFVLSREEEEYLSTNPKIRIVTKPGIEPISFWEENEFKGISADIMKYLLDDLNIDVEYILPKTVEEGYEMLAKGEAEIACLFESDYNLAEKYKTHITTPYFKSDYGIVFRNAWQGSSEKKFIATPEGGIMQARYSKENYPNAEVEIVSSNDAAIKSVLQGKNDMAFVNIYASERAIADHPELMVSFVMEDEQQFSIGVSQRADSRLYSILDKKINAIDSTVLSDILSRHTMFKQQPMTLENYFRQHPMQVGGISLAVFLFVIAFLGYVIVINKKHAKHAYELAYVDSLTGLNNINGFLLQGKSILEKYPEEKFAVAAIDLSKFSSVNENYGRKIGDKVIENMGNSLKMFRDDYTVIAHGDADHFLMLLNYKDENKLQALVEEIGRMISNYNVEKLDLQFHVYMGISMVEGGEDTFFKAIDFAHTARSKCNREQSTIYMDEKLKKTLDREKEIRENLNEALIKGEFEVHYQPKFDISKGSMIGAEALVRWNHSKLGFLSPAEFIPVLEQDGTVTEVDFYVLEQACKMVRKWIDAGQTPIVVSVNQSRAHFFKKDYIERLEDMIQKYHIPACHLELEITETLFGQEVISNSLIKKMKAIGFLTSIDDFGSGYSSLYLLHQISVDILKIDKGLLDKGDRHEKVRNIIRRIVQIADDINIDVICEGVETKEQVDFLLSIGCKYVQGFYFSKPLKQEDFELLVKDSVLGKMI